jgi:UDP-N-acetylglucosamine--N-acetylmuramyl-(pentapeptide) pyrophosphoryl-undecaprenol N-acetylglucosamine transferase
LRRLVPGVRPIFLCTKREIDRVILEPTGFEFICQPIIPPVRTIGGLLKFWQSWRETKDLVKKIIRQSPPAAALGLGGYAAGVAVKLSAGKGIPTAILNPDVIPGKANRYLMRDARAVCCQFAATAEFVPGEFRARIKVTGCPIRPDILALPPRETAKGRLGLDPLPHTLVITGASQGAQTVNEAVIEVLRSVTLRGWQILHLSGREHADAVRTQYRELNLPAHVIDFTPAMADVWACADLAVCRAGASTVAELCACGVPSILMPYPFHKDKHQRANAKVLADAGAAVLLDDEKDKTRNAGKLKPILEPLLYDADKRKAMADAARKLGGTNAAEAVARVLIDMAHPSRT